MRNTQRNKAGHVQIHQHVPGASNHHKKTDLGKKLCGNTNGEKHRLWMRRHQTHTRGMCKLEHTR